VVCHQSSLWANAPLIQPAESTTTQGTLGGVEESDNKPADEQPQSGSIYSLGIRLEEMAEVF
jgi:hypothetical protein